MSHDNTPENKRAELRRAALEYHEFPIPGKVAIAATKQLTNQRDLALAYSPGVAAPCEEIVADPVNAFKYTARGNLATVLYMQMRFAEAAEVLDHVLAADPANATLRAQFLQAVDDSAAAFRRTSAALDSAANGIAQSATIAVDDLNTDLTALEAAQSSFAKISQLN
mgnify:CR=1 FL=1